MNKLEIENYKHIEHDVSLMHEWVVYSVYSNPSNYQLCIKRKDDSTENHAGIKIYKDLSHDGKIRLDLFYKNWSNLVKSIDGISKSSLKSKSTLFKVLEAYINGAYNKQS